MKKRIFSLVLASLACGTTFAQTSIEFGEATGFSSYLGDLQPDQMTWAKPGFTQGVFVRENINPWVSFRQFAAFCRVSGSDVDSRVQSHINRNLSFRTNIFEMGAAVEVNMLPFDKFNPSNKRERRYFNFTPYANVGLAMFHFNPQALYQGQWIDLQPLNTEGQGSSFNSNQPYKLYQAAIPFSFGWKWQLSPRSTMSYEFSFRKTFTDYLDDVSGSYADPTKLTSEKGFLSAEMAYRTDELVGYEGTTPLAGSRRGDPANMDWYNMQTLSYTFKLYPAKRAFTGGR